MVEINDIIFNRLPMKYDHRDFRLSDFITPEIRALADNLVVNSWPVSKVLDQGRTGHCVGYAWAGFGISEPIADEWDNSMGESIYYQAKMFDGEPGQENGSTTRSGVQAFMKFGALQDNAYAFATSLNDIITWVLAVGPVVTGTSWYSGMMYPDEFGTVHLTGYVVGGHEWMISGVDKSTGMFRCTNSWGKEWGVGGQFYISFEDYQTLFDDEGDAVTTAEIIGLPPVPDPIPAPNGCSKVLYNLYKWSIKK